MSGWKLTAARKSDIDELMTWFLDAHSVGIWGGPHFRYPFDRKTFHADSRWREYSSYCLRDDTGQFAAFGQIGYRYQRAHLARLVANPASRGRGVGRELVRLLIAKAAKKKRFTEIALFVYRDNEAAIRCYRSVGFAEHDFPEDAPLADRCFYLTRPIADTY